MAVKSGIKTSEFWVSLIAPLAALVGTVLAGFGITVDTTQIVAFATTIVSAALASHGYSASRATVKAAATAVAPALVAQGVSPQNDLY